MMFPLVRDLAADKIPVAVTCRVLGFSKQAFYKWAADPVCQRDWDDAHERDPLAASAGRGTGGIPNKPARSCGRLACALSRRG